MSNQPCCVLTTKDFTILEIMRERCLGRDDPLAPILKAKIESAVVMFRDDVPANVATLNSRVTFSVDGRDPDTRVISPDRSVSPIGMFLPITTVRGLALLGLTEGQTYSVVAKDGEEERIMLHEVHYQPEAARREKEILESVTASFQKKPSLRVVGGSTHNQRRSVPVAPDGFDDPGPSAA